MAIETSSSSSSTQTSGAQQLTSTGTAQPMGKVGGSMVNSGDSVDISTLVAVSALAILSLAGAALVPVLHRRDRRRLHR